MNASFGKTFAAALILLDVGLLMWALLMGFHIEGTSEAIADAERGQRIAIPAGGSLLAAVTALAVGARRWRALPLVVAVLLAAVSVAVGLLT